MLFYDNKGVLMTYLMAIALKQKQNKTKKDENQKKKINCKVRGTNGLPA